MQKIIEWFRKIFGQHIIITIKKEYIKYGEFNDDTIKQVENLYHNTISELYQNGEVKAAQIVGKDLANIIVKYNTMKKV